jgi:hypothetical protein
MLRKLTFGVACLFATSLLAHGSLAAAEGGKAKPQTKGAGVTHKMWRPDGTPLRSQAGKGAKTKGRFNPKELKIEEKVPWKQ